MERVNLLPEDINEMYIGATNSYGEQPPPHLTDAMLAAAERALCTYRMIGSASFGYNQTVNRLLREIDETAPRSPVVVHSESSWRKVCGPLFLRSEGHPGCMYIPSGIAIWEHKYPQTNRK